MDTEGSSDDLTFYPGQSLVEKANENRMNFHQGKSCFVLTKFPKFSDIATKVIENLNSIEANNKYFIGIYA